MNQELEVSISLSDEEKDAILLETENEKFDDNYYLHPFNNYPENITTIKAREKLMYWFSIHQFEDIKKQHYFITAYEKFGGLNLETLIKDNRIVLKMNGPESYHPFSYTMPEHGIN